MEEEQLRKEQNRVTKIEEKMRKDTISEIAALIASSLTKAYSRAKTLSIFPEKCNCIKWI